MAPEGGGGGGAVRAGGGSATLDALLTQRTKCVVDWRTREGRGPADGEVSMTGVPRMVGRTAALGVLMLGAAACGAPSSTFVPSPDNDLVIKLPRSWSTVRDAASADSSTGQPDGGWNAVFDASRQPDATHVDLSSKVQAPVAYARVLV